MNLHCVAYHISCYFSIFHIMDKKFRGWLGKKKWPRDRVAERNKAGAGLPSAGKIFLLRTLAVVQAIYKGQEFRDHHVEFGGNFVMKIES